MAGRLSAKLFSSSRGVIAYSTCGARYIGHRGYNANQQDDRLDPHDW